MVMNRGRSQVGRLSDPRIIFCNGVFFIYALHYIIPFNFFFLALLANLLVFVVPGLGWTGILPKSLKNTILTILAVSAMSLGFLILGSLIRLLTEIPLSSVYFLVLLTITTNAGIFIFPRREDQKLIDNPKALKFSLVISLVLFCLLFFAGSRIPSLVDLDEEVPGASYGLVADLKPYMSYNSGYKYYFAHPPLSIFYGAYGALFLEKIHDMRYYYDAAKAIDDISYISGAKSSFEYPKSGGGSTKITIKHNENNFEAREIDGDNITVNTFKSQRELLIYFSERDRALFLRSDLLIPVRITNIFLFALSFAVIYLWCFSITQSSLTSLLLGLVFIFTVGNAVRSVSASHLAATNYSIIMLCYALFLSVRQKGELASQRILLLPGFFAAWANQKAIILLLAYGLWQTANSLINKESISGIIRKFLSNYPLIGFAFGMLAYVVYGVIIDIGEIYDFYIKEHLINRIRFGGIAGKTMYPNLDQLWMEFIIEAPLILLAVGLIATKWRSLKNEPLPLILTWLFLGCMIWSLVDWKQSRHFMTMLPAMFLLIAYMNNYLSTKGKQILTFCLAALIVYGGAFLSALVVDFEFYRPTPPIW